MNYDLISHPKAMALAIALGVRHNEAIGLLLRIRAFAQAHSADGGLCTFGASVLAQAVGWHGDWTVWRKALDDADLFWPVDNEGCYCDHAAANEWRFGAWLLAAKDGGQVAP